MDGLWIVAAPAGGWRDMFLHLAYERQGFTDKQGGMASSHPQYTVVVLQFVFGIRQRNLRPVRIAVVHQFHDFLDKAAVCGIQTGCFIAPVYKIEKILVSVNMRYSIFLSVLCYYTWFEACAHKTMGQIAVLGSVFSFTWIYHTDIQLNIYRKYFLGAFPTPQFLFRI